MDKLQIQPTKEGLVTSSSDEGTSGWLNDFYIDTYGSVIGTLI